MAAAHKFLIYSIEEPQLDFSESLYPSIVPTTSRDINSDGVIEIRIEPKTFQPPYTLMDINFVITGASTVEIVFRDGSANERLLPVEGADNPQLVWHMFFVILCNHRNKFVYSSVILTNKTDI